MKRKKILSILLVLTMICLCACGGGTHAGTDEKEDHQQEQQGETDNKENTGEQNTEKDNTEPEKKEELPPEKKSAIEPAKETEAKYLEIEDNIKVRLTRINTEKNKNAEALLELAYEALLDLRSGADVTALYSVPIGLALQSSSFDPVIIETSDSEIEKDRIFMVPFVAGENTSLLGFFRESEVTGSNYRDAAIKVRDDSEKNIIRALGFDKEGYEVKFDVLRINGCNISAPSETFKAIYDVTTQKYFNVMFAGWYTKDTDEDDFIEKDHQRFYRVPEKGVDSIKDLETYLKGSFTDEMTQVIMGKLNEKLYIEDDGKLYYLTASIGGAEDIQSIEPKYLAMNSSKTSAFLLIECKKAQYDDKNEKIIGTKYEEYMFAFKKADNQWKCSNYQDIPFGIVGWQAML